MSEIRPEDFNAPRNPWEKVFDDGPKEGMISNFAGHMSTGKKDEIMKRQIGIFCEVPDDIATRFEKATDIKEYGGISELNFNGRHNVMAKDRSHRIAIGMDSNVKTNIRKNNGTPMKGVYDEPEQKEINGKKETNEIHQQRNKRSQSMKKLGTFILHGICLMSDGI